ncbi:MAG TPA: hypothetical protein VJI33_00640 [Candidatus Paceibacterota bacterium]
MKIRDLTILQTSGLIIFLEDEWKGFAERENYSYSYPTDFAINAFMRHLVEYWRGNFPDIDLLSIRFTPEEIFWMCKVFFEKRAYLVATKEAERALATV